MYMQIYNHVQLHTCPFKCEGCSRVFIACVVHTEHIQTHEKSCSGGLWRLYPVEGYHDTHWLTGLWSTQAIVEGIVVKAAWQWDSDSIVIIPLGNQAAPHCM